MMLGDVPPGGCDRTHCILHSRIGNKQRRQATSSQKHVDRLREARIKSGWHRPMSSWQPRREPVLLLLLCMLCPWAGSRVRLSAKRSELRGVTSVKVEWVRTALDLCLIWLSSVSL